CPVLVGILKAGRLDLNPQSPAPKGRDAHMFAVFLFALKNFVSFDDCSLYNRTSGEHLQELRVVGSKNKDRMGSGRADPQAVNGEAGDFGDENLCLTVSAGNPHP
ncbi:MAG: hypothetical protein ABC611_08120, partial [Candidatus Methanosuratincola petrocarbonis]